MRLPPRSASCADAVGDHGPTSAPRPRASRPARVEPRGQAARRPARARATEVRDESSVLHRDAAGLASSHVGPSRVSSRLPCVERPRGGRSQNDSGPSRRVIGPPRSLGCARPVRQRRASLQFPRIYAALSRFFEQIVRSRRSRFDAPGGVLALGSVTSERAHGRRRSIERPEGRPPRALRRGRRRLPARTTLLECVRSCTTRCPDMALDDVDPSRHALRQEAARARSSSRR